MLKRSCGWRLNPIGPTGLIAFVIIAAILSITAASSAAAESNVRGLPPKPDATYIPKLSGLLNETHHNQYGQARNLAECLVLRESKIDKGKAHVPAGGLYYASSTSADARPFMREPIFLLGELAYLLRSTNMTVVKKNFEVKKGDKGLLNDAGYRVWYEYSTDHYGKPYGEFSIMAPSGGWPMQWPISTSFPEPVKALELKTQEGINPQMKEFYMSNTYLFGVTKMIASKITDKTAVFSHLEYPEVKEAIFSMDRPYTVGIRQESYRWYGTKRIYAFRKEEGILIEVRNWSGSEVLASKLMKVSTQQEYKVLNQDDYCLTDLDLDIHVELVVEPDWRKYSDFAPWTTGVPFGWDSGTVVVAVYGDLVKLVDGKPWPRDDRYIVRLEPNLQSGHLKRVVLENKEAFDLDNANPKHQGPVKISEVWDRPYFNVVADQVEEKVAKSCYVRDSWFRRTDELILWKDGRENIDFFVGMSELVVAVMEDTFLQRLADPSYGVPVVKSNFTSYPRVVPDAKWFAPDPGAAFVPKLKGFQRAFVNARDKQRLTASEALVIRQSYVDYRNGKIIIPPGGMYYTSRLGRNIRPLNGEWFFILGKRANLLSNKSYLVVKKDFRIDFWKPYPMGDGNPLFWQDMPLGDGSKAMRYLRTGYMWGRPYSESRITKYSGNDWGAKLLSSPQLSGYKDLDKLPKTEGEFPQPFQYYLPEVIGEGGTYLIPKFVAPDFVEVAEMGTPGMDSFKVAYEPAKKAVLADGQEVKVGKYRLTVKDVDTGANAVKLVLMDESGAVAAEKQMGPIDQDVYDTLPQYSPSQEKVMFQHEDIHVELELPAKFAEGKVTVWYSTGVVEYKRNQPWPSDPRFLIMPDVCGHCFMLNEFVLANKDPIVIDEKNPVFDGPDGYFKVVVDDFDGEAINAWHIEDKEGKPTPNLAEYARNNVDVLVGVNGTVESFLRLTLLDRLAYREVWRLK